MPRPKFRDADDEKLREDTAETAYRTLQEAIGERPKTVPDEEPTEKNLAAVERGRKGGKKGGKARADAMSDKQRAQSAKNAAKARWRQDDP